MARVGTDVLRALGAPGALHASYYAEIEPKLKDAVEGAWRKWQKAGGGVPYTPVAGDVWDLLRDGAAPFRQ
eukprot:863487-Lingulodinium_polyedra.AAC.1